MQSRNIPTYFYCIFLLIFFFSSYLFAHAQIAGIDDRAALVESMVEKRSAYDETRDSIGERRDEVVATIASSSDEFKKKITERRAQLVGRVKERVHNLFENITMRLSAIIERFEQISARIDSRINKSKTVGMDTTAAEHSLNEARMKLADARAALDGIMSSDLNQVIDADSPIEKFRILRASIIAIREGLGETQRSLQEAVNALKNTTLQAPTPEVPATDISSSSTTVE